MNLREIVDQDLLREIRATYPRWVMSWIENPDLLCRCGRGAGFLIYRMVMCKDCKEKMYAVKTRRSSVEVEDVFGRIVLPGLRLFGEVHGQYRAGRRDQFL